MKILMYRLDSPHKVYCYSCWWSDKWQGETFGHEYDFSKPFFKQFKELLLSVPRPGIIKQQNQIEMYCRFSSKVSFILICAAEGPPCAAEIVFLAKYSELGLHSRHHSESPNRRNLDLVNFQDKRLPKGFDKLPNRVRCLWSVHSPNLCSYSIIDSSTTGITVKGSSNGNLLSSIEATSCFNPSSWNGTW